MSFITLILGIALGSIIGVAFFQINTENELSKGQPKEIIKYVYIGGNETIYEEVDVDTVFRT